MNVILAALAVWALSGIIIAALLARHGHNLCSHRRHPNITTVRGSTVGRLARNVEVPVLIGLPA
jgi:hypothetical protein